MRENVLRVIRGVKSVYHAYPIVTNLIDLKNQITLNPHQFIKLFYSIL